MKNWLFLTEPGILDDPEGNKLNIQDRDFQNPYI
jgi:hypothetical protein